jgi:hypothetical protein
VRPTAKEKRGIRREGKGPSCPDEPFQATLPDGGAGITLLARRRPRKTVLSILTALLLGGVAVVTHAGKTSSFRWERAGGWDRKGLCRVVVRGGKFAVLFPRMGVSGP